MKLKMKNFPTASLNMSEKGNINTYFSFISHHSFHEYQNAEANIHEEENLPKGLEEKRKRKIQMITFYFRYWLDSRIRSYEKC